MMPTPRPFRFDRDTFTFANDLVWEYNSDPVNGVTSSIRDTPPPPYTHRCFVMVRSARQFLFHARFDPTLPPADTATYQKCIRAVVKRNPRQPSLDSEKIVIPGFDCLRAFSQAHDPLLKAGCGGAWQSYFVRSHWRMVYPVPRQHQERMAHQLLQSIPKRGAAIVHLFRFPHITINHGIILFNATETESDILFDAYDPNIPAHPVKLIYERPTQTFTFQKLHYWSGGALNVYEMYIGGLY